MIISETDQGSPGYKATKMQLSRSQDRVAAPREEQVSCDWRRAAVLTSDWFRAVVLTSDWSRAAVLTSDWSRSRRSWS